MANSPRCVCIWYRVKSVNILFVFNLWISDWIHVYIYILLDDYMIQNIDIHYRFPHPLWSNTSATCSIIFMPPPPAFLGGPNCSRHKQNTPWFAPHLRRGFRSHHQSLAVVFFANTWVSGTRLYPYLGSSTGSNTWRAPEFFAGCWLRFPEAKKNYITLLGGANSPEILPESRKNPFSVPFLQFCLNTSISTWSHRNTQSSPSHSQCHAPEPSCA